MEKERIENILYKKRKKIEDLKVKLDEAKDYNGKQKLKNDIRLVELAIAFLNNN